MNRPLMMPRIPPLEQGDHLTRGEFERRYQAMPQVKKAELIEGVVYVPSPVRFGHHADPHGQMIGLLYVYNVHTPGTWMATDGTVRMDMDNEVQPNGALFIDPACGGRVVISDDDYVEGGPELLAEIAASTVSIDLNKKLHVYRRNQVQEYVVWRVQDEAIDWFFLNEGHFDPMPKTEGIYHSRVFPGLWLDADALVRGDKLRVLTVLQQGIASAEHAAFVSRLRAAGAPKQ